MLERDQVGKAASCGNAGSIAPGHPPINKPGRVGRAIKPLFHPLSPLYVAPRMLVECETLQEMRCVVECLPGQLTASLFVDGADVEMARTLMPMLERKVGRIVCNGYPTGVEVSYAMVHGGPFPATSDSRVTSVGATAIERFLRPVCYQNMPAALLPHSLQEKNSLNIWRLRDGKLTQS